jgi:hypothetical protein
MTTPQNLVDLANTVYGPHFRCRCGLVVYRIHGRWLDCSGFSYCWSLNAEHVGKDPDWGSS